MSVSGGQHSVNFKQPYCEAHVLRFSDLWPVAIEDLSLLITTVVSLEADFPVLVEPNMTGAPGKNLIETL